MKQIKSYLRWFFISLSLFFIGHIFRNNWEKIAAFRLDDRDYLLLILVLLTTLLAHIWSGWVWTIVLKELQIPVDTIWAIKIYLKTNLAKYLPGNVGHFYLRITAISQAGGSLAMASLSVLLEPLLMVAAALIIALIGSFWGLVDTRQNILLWLGEIIFLLLVLTAIHPRFCNPLLNFIGKFSKSNGDDRVVCLTRYPRSILLGEIVFILLRSTGFLLSLAIVVPLDYTQVWQTIAAFSCAWLLGLIIPGAPGGLGVFEATIVALLDSQLSGVVVLAAAFYRLASILAELIGAGIASIALPSKS